MPPPLARLLLLAACGLRLTLTAGTAAPDPPPYAAFSENTRQLYTALHLNSRLQQEVSRLSPSIADAAFPKLMRAGPEISIENNNAVGIDRGGNIYITELPVNRTGPPGRRRRALDNAGDMTPERVTANGLPIKHSRSSSDNVIYLDFDGHEQVQLNPPSGWTSFSAVAFDLDGDNTTFNADEQASTGFQLMHVHANICPLQPGL